VLLSEMCSSLSIKKQKKAKTKGKNMNDTNDGQANGGHATQKN